MKLRIAGPDDAPALAASVYDGFASYAEWAPAGWTPPPRTPESLARAVQRLSREDVWCVLGEDGAQVAGHASISPVTTEEPEPAPPGTINLWQMFVRAPWRGTGLAAELLDAAIGEATARGHARMRLWTPRGAVRARGFYERMGFSATGQVHEHSSIGLPTVEYERTLTRRPERGLS